MGAREEFSSLVEVSLDRFRQAQKAKPEIRRTFIGLIEDGTIDRGMIGVLSDHATPTLKNSFQRAVAVSGEVDAHRFADSLCQGLLDPVSKILSVLDMTRFKKRGEEDREIYRRLLVFRTLLADIVHNYGAIAPVGRTGEGAYSRFLSYCEQDLCPSLDDLADRFSAALNLAGPEVNSLKLDVSASCAEGYDHMKTISFRLLERKDGL